jgi:ABC-type dipeptide/oligopeptide/nickel transport system ATPase component
MKAVLASGLGLELDGRRLLDGIDLDLEAGMPHAFVGERLAGKTLLLRALVGMWPEGSNWSGELTVRGKELTAMSIAQRRDERREGLLYLPPSGRSSLNPVERIGRQIEDVWSSRQADAGRRRNWAPALRRESVAALSSLGIGDPERVLEALPDELSGGMNKRVLLAMALLLRPAVLAADEPTSGLDVTIQRQILDMLADLQREEGFTLLIATQDLGIVAQYAQTVTVMQAGRVVESTVPERFFAGPESEAARSMLERARAA